MKKTYRITLSFLGLILVSSWVGAVENTRVLPRGKTDITTINKKWTDIAYASVSTAHKLDIYLPDTGKAPFPVVVFIHGGAFVIGDKQGPALKPLLTGLDRGYAVVSVNYRYSTQAQWPACVEDVKAAIRWLRAHGQQYQLNTKKVALWGNSAGSYLAALVGVSANLPKFTEAPLGNITQSDKVQAVVDLFGPINFLSINQHFKQSGLSTVDNTTENSIETQLFGRNIDDIPKKLYQSNPESYISADDPPFFIQHGRLDTLVPVQQSIEFAKKLRKVLGKEQVFMEVLEGAEHGDTAFDSPENIKKIFDFLDEKLK